MNNHEERKISPSVSDLLNIAVKVTLKLDDLKSRFIPLHDSGNNEITELVEQAHSIFEAFGYNYTKVDANAQEKCNAAIERGYVKAGSKWPPDPLRFSYVPTRGPTEEDDIERARRLVEDQP